MLHHLRFIIRNPPDLLPLPTGFIWCGCCCSLPDFFCFCQSPATTAPEQAIAILAAAGFEVWALERFNVGWISEKLR